MATTLEANQKSRSSTSTNLSPPKTPASIPFAPGVARCQKSDGVA